MLGDPSSLPPASWRDEPLYRCVRVRCNSVRVIGLGRAAQFLKQRLSLAHWGAIPPANLFRVSVVLESFATAGEVLWKYLAAWIEGPVQSHRPPQGRARP
jgi:hypothetical protein